MNDTPEEEKVRVALGKATFIKEHVDSFTSCEFSFLVLGVNSLLTTTQTRFFTQADQRLYLFKLLAHNVYFS